MLYVCPVPLVSQVPVPASAKSRPLAPCCDHGRADAAAAGREVEGDRHCRPGGPYRDGVEPEALREELIHRVVAGINIGDIQDAAGAHRHANNIGEQRDDTRGRGTARRHLLHHVVSGIADVDVAAPVHRNAKGRVEAATQHGHATGGSAVRGHFLHRAVVLPVSNIDVVTRVHRHLCGRDEAGTQWGDAGGRGTVRRHFLHRIVAVIGDVDVAAGVHGHALGIHEAAAQRRDAGGRGAARGHFLHRAVAVIGDVDVAAGVHGHAGGKKEAGAQRRHAGGCGAAWGHLLDRAALFVGDINVAARVHGHAVGQLEAAAQRHGIPNGGRLGVEGRDCQEAQKERAQPVPCDAPRACPCCRHGPGRGFRAQRAGGGCMLGQKPIAEGHRGNAQRDRSPWRKLLVTKSARMGIQGGVYPTASAAALGTPATRPDVGERRNRLQSQFRSVRTCGAS